MPGISQAVQQRSRELIEAARQQGFGPQTPAGPRNTEIRRLHKAGALQAHIADLFGCSVQVAHLVVHGYRNVQLSPREYQVVKAMREGRATIQTRKPA